MAKFNYRLFRIHLQELIKEDFKYIRMFDAPLFICLMYPLNYCDIFDKVESCVRSLVKFGVIDLVEQVDNDAIKVRVLKIVPCNGF